MAGNVEVPNILYGRTHAAIFPGQGNQDIGMGFDLAERSAAAKGVWLESDNALRRDIGYDFSEFVWRGTRRGIAFHEDPDKAKELAFKELTRNENAQPAIIIASLASMAALTDLQLLGEPYFFAGNSLGLLTALRAAKCLSLSAIVQLGKERGDLFKSVIENSPKTTMIALNDVEPEIMDETRQRFELETCLINTDTQFILGGLADNVGKAFNYLREERNQRKVMVLDVDAAFHCKYMEPAVALYQQIIDRIPVEDPVGVAVIGASGYAKELPTAKDIKKELVSQLTQTEDWRAAAHFLRDQGVVVTTEFNNTPRLTHMNISMFDPKNRPQRLATPSLGEGDRGVTVAQRWQASWLNKAA